MTKHYTYTAKLNGDTLNATEWNDLAQDVDAAVNAINAGSGSGSGNGLPNLYINAKGNLNLETSAELGNTSKGKINIESMDDIQIKPGDDIILYSHHRDQDKQDEVAVKVTDGDDVPVKLQLNAAEMVLTTKDKTGNDANVMDVTVNSGKNTRGYLKVRAQAIDLRSESHGGIALQPKGEDGQGHMNKIKFEHGGGDGLEFGTFNAEKTSIFTDEYRFNKDGVWKMATRQKSTSDKYDDTDETTHYKYTKQTDDFYDIIDPYNQSAGTGDEQCTTKDIIKTAFAMNGGKDRHTKITKKGAIEIATNTTYVVQDADAGNAGEANVVFRITKNGGIFGNIDSGCIVGATLSGGVYTFQDRSRDIPSPPQYEYTVDTTENTLTFLGMSSSTKRDYTEQEMTDAVGTTAMNEIKSIMDAAVEPIDIIRISTKIAALTVSNGDIFNEGDFEVVPTENTNYTNGTRDFSFSIVEAPDIKIESGAELKLGGILDFGSSFNFGETDNGIQTQYKLTKKNALKDCGKLQVLAVNNHASNNITIDQSKWVLSDPSDPTSSLVLDDSQATIAPGETAIVAEASLYDIIKLVNYMKSNEEGPWAPAASQL